MGRPYECGGVLEVERHAGRDGLGLVAGNHVVVRIAAADAIAVTAYAQAIMRTGAVSQVAADDIPAHERTEVVFEPDRVLVCTAVERVKREVGRPRW